MKLAIISHTPHYYNDRGKIVGWGPTITEINHLATVFDEIYHVSVLSEAKAPPSALPYTTNRIHFVPLREVGGPKPIDKLNVLFQAPDVLNKVQQTLKKVDVFQLRSPTGMGVYLIPYLTWYIKNKGWYKYAGNWNQKNAPMGFALQRWMLKKQKRPVTINGKWEKQPKHCITFENPCLTSAHRNEGLELIAEKKFIKPYTICFVGRLEDEKGVRRILEALSKLKSNNNIKEVHFIGDGPNMVAYKNQAEKININIIFHGFFSLSDTFKIYKKSQFFLLPSTASEGFPKVIAEAMNFGCIPVVSDVSSIGQYVKHQKNGYIVSPNTADHLARLLDMLLESDPRQFSKMLQKNHKIAKLFTYKRYLGRIESEIVN